MGKIQAKQSIDINGVLPSCTICHTERPSSLSDDQIWRQGDFKNPNFQNLWWIGKNLEVQPRLFKNIVYVLSTAQGHHFKIHILNLWMNWENLYRNVRFTLEKKIRNSHKKWWSDFKLDIYDWDIPFPKILRI